MTQQAFVLWFADEGNTNLGALNSLLAAGKHVAFASAMSGTGEQGPEDPQSPFPYSRAALVLAPGGTGTQSAFILWFADEGSTNLAALNRQLASGWTVVNLVPMSGTGEHGNETPQSPFPYSRALAILQR
ncbi:MAG TPA: hypothetical protein VMT37_15950 [Solirubrobacterales bacterium]|nr:hypothetical protein [Solirubrobacterales bacterium]